MTENTLQEGTPLLSLIVAGVAFLVILAICGSLLWYTRTPSPPIDKAHVDDIRAEMWDCKNNIELCLGGLMKRDGRLWRIRDCAAQCGADGVDAQFLRYAVYDYGDDGYANSITEIALQNETSLRFKQLDQQFLRQKQK